MHGNESKIKRDVDEERKTSKDTPRKNSVFSRSPSVSLMLFPYLCHLEKPYFTYCPSLSRSCNTCVRLSDCVKFNFQFLIEKSKVFEFSLVRFLLFIFCSACMYVKRLCGWKRRKIEENKKRTLNNVEHNLLDAVVTVYGALSEKNQARENFMPKSFVECCR